MKTLNQYAWLFSVCITALGWVWVMAGERAVTQQKLDDMDNRLTAVQQRNQMLDEKLIVIHNSLIQVKRHWDLSLRQVLSAFRLIPSSTA